MNINRKLKVSVCMTSYFHEKYIRQAIESVLSQNTNFDYQIVICDDCSKDRTQEIIKELAEKFDFIKYKFNESNKGLTKNVWQAKCMCEGEYIIQLSGDDYWIDNDKLQKQVDFLDSHKEYFGIVTRIVARTNEAEETDFVLPYKKDSDKRFRLCDYLAGKNVPTNGLLYRNLLNEKKDFFSLMPKVSPDVDDVTDCLLMLMCGDIYISRDITVVYRRRIADKKEHNFNSINTGLKLLKKEIFLLNNLYTEFRNKCDLFHRYKVALGPEIAKHLRPAEIKEIRIIFRTIPIEYRKRGLLIRSFLYCIPKTLDVVTRRFRK